MKTIIELARVIYGTQYTEQDLDFATLVEAAQLERLLQGVEMREPDTHCWDADTEADVWSHSRDQLRSTVAAAVVKKDAETALQGVSDFGQMQELLAERDEYQRAADDMAMSHKVERDTLKAENERLTRQAFSVAVERDELRMELGDLPEAQAEMLTTIKQLKADNERLRGACRMQALHDFSRDLEKADAKTERLVECAIRLVEHADFKLGGILSADSKSKDIPSKATSYVKSRHLAALRDALAALKGQP